MTIHCQFAMSKYSDDPEELLIDKVIVDILSVGEPESEDEEPPEALVGEMEVSIVRLGEICNAGFRALLAMDDASEELGEFGKLVLNHEGFLKERFLVEGFDQGIMFLDRIKIKPEFRGQGIASEAIPHVIRSLRRGVGLVGLCASPFEVELGDENRKAADRRLQAFYRRLGFKNIQRSKYMFMDPQDAASEETA